MSKFTEDAKLLLEYIGGKDNIKAVTHCVTRMRFVLIDEKKADVKKIESLSFEGCSSLETLVIPDNITIRGIASGAFDGCTSLNSINIPDNIRIIEDYTFRKLLSMIKLSILLIMPLKAVISSQSME